MKKSLATILPLLLLATSCTYNISMVHTEGQASDVVDDTTTTEATTNASANVPINP